MKGGRLSDVANSMGIQMAFYYAEIFSIQTPTIHAGRLQPLGRLRSHCRLRHSRLSAPPLPISGALRSEPSSLPSAQFLPLRHYGLGFYLRVLVAQLILGILIGWTWRPRWANSLFQAIKSTPCESWTASPDLDIKKSCQTVDKKSAESVAAKACCCPCSSAMVVPSKQFSDDDGSLELIKRQRNITANLARSTVGEADLLDLHRTVHGKEGGLPWDLMMERSAPGMTYQAWRRDPKNGPTEYKSRTIFEDSTPELVKDFYWDDEFRSVWDDMLIFAQSKEDCTETGAQIVHWVRKFPFFCSDREYLIGRRIFEVDGSFYCVTKAVPYAAVPRRDKPLRVDVYNSSWCIRAGESCVKKGQLTACEVMFFHAEDMHIPKNIAKLGVRQGMWGLVKKMEPGLRKYQAQRAMAKPLSKSARMAQAYTRMSPNYFDSLSVKTLEEEFAYDWSGRQDDDVNYEDNDVTRSNEVTQDDSCNQGGGWKWMIVGGAVVLACTLDRGVLGRAVIFGLARRFGMLNQRIR
ncbi:hypothetical protein GOP47_0018509 [Adiantum capillus-veneris]|uniref:START domain-containing protein n=1 Tax=Adiantum capillus-veneris TaxID=13818 RepID=A0A9D4UDI9_ADICA|nr:hypothetical protein GOP47_0018509 [Adiantum capillus-veneris]